jgi:hypothetical protein
MVYRRAPSRRARRFIILTLALGAELLYPVLEQRGRDRGAVRLASRSVMFPARLSRPGEIKREPGQTWTVPARRLGRKRRTGTGS